MLAPRPSELMGRARQNPKLTGVFTTFSAGSPQVYLEIDREKARMLNVPIAQHLRDAAVQSRHGLRERLQRLRPRLPGACAGGAALPPRCGGYPAPARTLVYRRARAAWHAGRHSGNDGPDLRAALQHVSLGAAAGQRGARRLIGGSARRRWRRSPRETLPQGIGFQWTELAFQETRDRQHGGLHLRAVRVVRVPRARGPIRELVAAARHHSDRADGGPVGARGRDAARAWTTTS